MSEEASFRDSANVQLANHIAMLTGKRKDELL